MTQPWAHQIPAIAYAAGHKTALLHMWMGTGKTLCALETCRERGHMRILLLCPKSVVAVWAQEIAKHVPGRWLYAPLAGATTAKATQLDRLLREGRPMVVGLNYEAVWREPLAKLILATQWDCLVMDECVPGDTKIATPQGDKTIEELAVGDVIWGYNHKTRQVEATKVKAVFTRQTAKPLCQIGETSLTPNHPVYTQWGYLPAFLCRNLDSVWYTVLRYQREGGSHGEENVSTVRRRLRNAAERTEVLLDSLRRQSTPETLHCDCVPVVREDLLHESESFPALLRQKLFGKMAHVAPGVRSYAGHEETSGTRAATHEAELEEPGVCPESEGVYPFRQESIPRSDTRTRTTPQGHGGSSGKRLASALWRQWPRPYFPATGSLQSARGRLVHGTQYRASQMGYRQPEGKDSNRSGRAFSQGDQGQGRRSPQGKGCGIQRVAGIPILELGRSGQPSRSPQPSQAVYNIETATGNYFANGLLVHNCQKIKAPGSRQSRFVSRIKAEHKLALTGTPMPSSPLDLYGQFRTLAPWIFGRSFVRFRRRYAVLAGPQNNWVVGFQNGPELREKMNQITYHVPKEVLSLPPLTVSARNCTLGKDAKRIYMELETELIAAVREGVVTAANAAVKVMRLQQVAAGYARTEDGIDIEVDGSKRALLEECIEAIDPAEPVVVFARFIHDLAAVEAVAEKLGRRHGEISGAQNDYDGWQRGEVNVLGVQIQAGGLGIDLSRARYCFFYTLMYSLGSYDQAVARLHRPGQVNPVAVYHLVAEDTVDVKIRRALEKRRNVIEAILEDYGDERSEHGERERVCGAGVTEEGVEDGT